MLLQTTAREGGLAWIIHYPATFANSTDLQVFTPCLQPPANLRIPPHASTAKRALQIAKGKNDVMTLRALAK
jgi:hypothetical protein